MNPLISIIIPIYKAEKTIAACISSLLTQTYMNLEIILVDDASPDHSGKICEEYSRKDNRIKVIRKEENGGAGSARNTGIDICNGEYIGFVDSDDTVEPTMYEMLYHAMRETNAEMAVCGMKIMEDSFTRCVTVPKSGFMSKTELCNHYIKNYLEYLCVLSGPCNKLISKQLLKFPYSESKTMPPRFPENMINAEDICFNNHLIAHLSYGVVFLDQTPYIYNMNANSESLSKEYSAENVIKALSIWYQTVNENATKNRDMIEAVYHCQKAICYMNDIHKSIILNNESMYKYKLTFSQLKCILKHSNSFIIKCSAMIAYFLPPICYKVIFKIFRR